MNRIFIYPKDVQILTGRSERHARNLLNQIKKNYNKQKHQPVTIFEFCEYLNIPTDKITQLKN